MATGMRMTTTTSQIPNMFEDFFLRAMIAGLGAALVAGPLGCFVVWRRMAYFGDATAHAALLGVALALAFELPVVLGVLLVAVVMAAIIALSIGRDYSADTMLGVLSHGALAFGLLSLSLLEGVRVDLTAYLFGDILAVDWGDVAIVWLAGTTVLAVLVWRWRHLLNSTLNAELARAEGGRPGRDRLLLTVLLAILVAIAIKIVGVLLITALLIMPAAAVRPLTRSPAAMALGAAGAGALSVLTGLPASFALDTPSGPTIVAGAVVVFLLGNILGQMRR